MTTPSLLSALRQLALRREYGIALLLAITVIAVTIANPAFASPANIRDMLVNCVPAAIVGCGLTFVILAGEIDISMGALMGLLAVVLGLLSSPEHAGFPVSLSICLTLALGALIGAVNGLLVTAGRVPSIIATLGMLSLLRGVTALAMDGQWITRLPDDLRYWGTGDLAGVRVSLWVAAGVAIAAALTARCTPLGLRIYAVGSNPQAARLAGISPARVKLVAFTLTGFLVGVATVASVPQLAVIDPGIGAGLELMVVTCVIVGGASPSGGKGTIAGTLLAVALLGMVRTMLIFLNLGDASVYWERAIQGAFILAAVLVDHVARGRGQSELAP